MFRPRGQGSGGLHPEVRQEIAPPPRPAPRHGQRARFVSRSPDEFAATVFVSHSVCSSVYTSNGGTDQPLSRVACRSLGGVPGRPLVRRGRRKPCRRARCSGGMVRASTDGEFAVAMPPHRPSRHRLFVLSPRAARPDKRRHNCAAGSLLTGLPQSPRSPVFAGKDPLRPPLRKPDSTQTNPYFLISEDKQLICICCLHSAKKREVFRKGWEASPPPGS